MGLEFVIKWNFKTVTKGISQGSAALLKELDYVFFLKEFKFNVLLIEGEDLIKLTRDMQIAYSPNGAMGTFGQKFYPVFLCSFDSSLKKTTISSIMIYF